MDRKKIPKDFEENRTRVEPLLNETPPTLPTLPSAAKIGESTSVHNRIRPTSASFRAVVGRVGFMELGLCGIVGSMGRTPMVGLLAGYIGN